MWRSSVPISSSFSIAAMCRAILAALIRRSIMVVWARGRSLLFLSHYPEPVGANTVLFGQLVWSHRPTRAWRESASL